MNRKNKNLLDIIPLYSPRTTCSRMKINDERMIADITLNFDKITISLLKQQFEKKNGNLKLQQFIVVAKKHLKFWQPNLHNRQTLIVKYLAQLFNQIDINGNGDMEWKEFTSYIIEKATVLKNLKTKSQEIKKYVKSQVEPKIKIDGMIQKAQYIKDLGKVAFFEEGASTIYFMDANDGSLNIKPLQIDPKKLVITISSVKKNKAGKVQIRKKDMQIPSEVRVLDMIYLQDKKYKTLFVSTSDGYVRGWKFSQNGFILANQPDNQEQLFEHYFSSQIYCLAWDNVNEVLYCGQKNGNIYMWNLKTDLQKTLFQTKNENFQQKQIPQQKINLLITSMITMPKLQFMASGRMDGKLILWDTINYRKKWTYKEHTRGILTLAFNQSMILLFSAGFDHKICIWNPYIASLIHKIQSHLAPILTLRIIQNSNQLVSMDSDGVVKITDTRRFHQISSFSVEKQQNQQLNVNGSSNNSSNLSSFMVTDKPLKLFFIGKSISIYEYDKNYNPHCADENIVVACFYIKQMLSFITAAGTKVKIWSALNGDIDKIYIDIAPYQITAFALDSLKKRMIIGDCGGNLSVHNVLNGAKLKSLAKHNTEITNILTMKRQTEMLITCSLDNQIRIFKEDDDNYEVIRFIYFRKDIQITTLNYEAITNFIVVGTNVGTVGFYDLQTGKNVGNCLNSNYDQVSSLTITHESIMVTTTATGKIHLYLIPPSSNKFERLVTLTHKDCQKEGDTSLGIRSSTFSKKQNLLYVIDDKMYLTCYDLNKIQVLKNDIKNANGQTQKIIQIFKQFKKNKFNKKWQCKTNHQIVKQMDIIQEEGVLVTIGFDKKVKFWKAQNGQFIDSLQQNYSKFCPEPIGYYDMRNQILYSKNKKETYDNIQLDTTNIQYDCSQIVDLQNKYKSFKNVNSNKQWNVFVQFNEDFLKKSAQIKVLMTKIADSENEIQMFESANCHKRINKKKIISNLEQTKNYLKALRKQLNKDQNQTQTNFYPLKLKKKETLQFKSNPSLKKSFMQKNFQNYQNQKYQSQLFQLNTQKPKLSRKATNSKDYTPIYQILAKNQRDQNCQNKHQAFIDSLYKKQTESMMLGKKQQQIYMSKQEVNATKKLCKVLMEIDNQDKRPTCLLKRIKVKQSTQSMHSTISHFPKI